MKNALAHFHRLSPTAFSVERRRARPLAAAMILRAWKRREIAPGPFLAGPAGTRNVARAIVRAKRPYSGSGLPK